jgi:hypothetical protein
VGTGTPEELAKWKPSYTGQYIKELLEQRSKRLRIRERDRQARQGTGRRT